MRFTNTIKSKNRIYMYLRVSTHRVSVVLSAGYILVQKSQFPVSV